MRVLAIIAAALAATAAVAAPGDNLLDNPGFESGPWPQSPGWHGTIEAVAENALSGEQAGKLVVGEEGDATIYSGYVPAVVGLRYRFTIQAKGAGTISLRSIQLTTDPDERYLIERPENHMELTDEWQEIAIEINPEDPRVLKIAVVVQLDGQGATAFLDDALLTTLGLPGGELTVTPSYAMVQPGGSASFEIAVRCDAGPIVEGELQVSVTLGEETTRATVPIAGETTTWEFAAPADAAPSSATVTALNGEVGAGQSAWVDVVDAETYAAFAAAAAAAQIETPAHLLFIGDSLTDRLRGHNYTDMVGFWLRRAHGEVTYRNAGVGGDFITRVWQRMDDPEHAYRPEMYEDLFEPTPTHVFIFLGHNDSKLKPRPEYTSPDDYPFDPVVPLDEFATLMTQTIERIRENAPEAQITILSASSSVHEITRETVVRRIAENGNGGSYFGRPDVLERFNEVMQQVAQDTNSGYLDVYTPTRDAPNKPALFTADGVHITPLGNQLIARLILGRLGEVTAPTERRLDGLL